MIKVYATQDTLLLGHLKCLLDGSGIRCITKNVFLTGAAGELPPIECWPELWVVDDEEAAKAATIIEEALKAKETPKSPWRCANCGEEIEGQFTECWNCGKSRAGEKE